MKIEFNKGKIEDKETDEIKEEITEEVEEQEDVHEKKSFVRQNDLKKPLLKIAIIISAVLGLLLIILLIISLMTPKTKSFEEIEAIMTNAAKSYFSERKNYLPENVGDVVEVDVANLVAAEKMKDLSEYTDENTVCSGRVEVEKTEDSYVFRGETVNNYVKLGNTMWRIVKINKDNSITLIEAEVAKVADKYGSFSFIWDDRYNTEKEAK